MPSKIVLLSYIIIKNTNKMPEANQQKIAKVPWMGKGQVDVVIDPKQWAKIKYNKNRNYFSVHKMFAREKDPKLEKFRKAYDEFCKKELENLVKRLTSKLLVKRVNFKKTLVDQKTGVKKVKTVRMNATERLKEYNFSQKVDIKVDNYDGAWGMNEPIIKNKKFILHFNLKLIQFGDQRKIEYVVTHEIAHIFYQDHSKNFDQVAADLYYGTRSAESFWNDGFLRAFRG